MAMPQVDQEYLKLIDLFVKDGFITVVEMQSALEAIARGDSLRTHLRTHLKDSINDGTYVNYVGMAFHIPSLDLPNRGAIPQEVMSLVPEELAHKYRVLPVELRYGDTLALAVQDPLTRLAVSDLTAVTGKKIRQSLSAKPLEGLIGEYYALQR